MATRKHTGILLMVIALLLNTDVRVSSQGTSSGSGTVPAALFQYLELVKNGAAPAPDASTVQLQPQQQPAPGSSVQTAASTSQQQSQAPAQSTETLSPAEMYARFIELMKHQNTSPSQQPAPAPQVSVASSGPTQEQIPPGFDPFGSSPTQQQQPPPAPQQTQQTSLQLTMQLPTVQQSQQPAPAPTETKPTIAYTRQGTIDFVPAEHKAMQPQAYRQPPQVHHQSYYHYNHATTRTPQRSSQTQSSALDWGAHAAPVPPPTPVRQYTPYNRYSGYNRYTTLSPRRRQVTSWTARMPLSPDMHNNLMAQARSSGLTRHYEDHGCFDPIMYMPPGSNTVGLSLGCANPMSQQLCQMTGQRLPGAAAGGNNNMAMMMMFAPPHMKDLLESCLSRTSLTKAMVGMANRGRGGGGGGMNPAAMALMMGGGGGGGGLMPLMMMNMVNGGGGQTQGGRQTVISPAASSLPAGAALPGGGTQPSPNQRTTAASTATPSKCASILPFVMMQGGEGGIMSPEGGDIVRDLRRQIFPYTCQEVGAGMMPVRMCCPGKVNHPSMIEFISSASAGA